MYFKDDDRINDLLSKPSVTESVFTSWMAANQMYHDAKKLTCGQFVSKFVYDKSKRDVGNQEKKVIQLEG